MPRTGRTKKIPQPKKAQKQITCMLCTKLKSESDYYVSHNPAHEGVGRLPWCRDCLFKRINLPNGGISFDALYEVLEMIDRPFLGSLWITASQDSDESNRTKKSVFGAYMRMLTLPQYKNLRWKDSDFNEEESEDGKVPNVSSNTVFVNQQTQSKEFILTDDIIDKWGEGYTPEQYRAFERKYRRLHRSFGEKTDLHTESFLTYIRFRVLEELASAKGDLQASKHYGNLAKDAAVAAKINVTQLSKSDLTDGLDVACQIFEAVESKVGIIPILPKLKEQPYDDADLIIWCIINYFRRLDDKPRVSYREIWNFYDEMLEEHYKTKGYNDEKINEEKQKRNNIFRDLSQVYKEPLYEDGDL